MQIMQFMLCSTEILLKMNPDFDQVLTNGGGAYARSFNGGFEYFK
jgi:hypothetical protein